MKPNIRIHVDAEEGSLAIADEMASLIRMKADEGTQCVLGLTTGSTPIKIYAELVRRHREEGLSFANVVTFNVDEYFPIQPDKVQSYRHFMHRHLFDHVDIRVENTYVPDGTVPASDLPEYCRSYERKIREVGGIDLQLLGIGRTGHIGFNEPGSSLESRTRLITLEPLSRQDVAGDFGSEGEIPTHAVTMGVATILGSRRIIMAAFGERKASIVATALEGPITPTIPASFLQQHANVLIVLDKSAAVHLKAS